MFVNIKNTRLSSLICLVLITGVASCSKKDSTPAPNPVDTTSSRPATPAFDVVPSYFNSKTTTEKGGTFTESALPFKLAPLKAAGTILFGFSNVL